VKKFLLGKPIDHFIQDMDIIRFHPWKDGRIKEVDERICYYSPELGMYTENILSMTLVLVSYKSLGYHSPELVAGICRMLQIDDPSVQRSKA